jgi:hypothetical protein
LKKGLQLKLTAIKNFFEAFKRFSVPFWSSPVENFPGSGPNTSNAGIAMAKAVETRPVTDFPS